MHQVIQTDNLFYENRLWEEGFHRVMGLDEVGRGCLAGPVVASGVILNPDTPVSGIDDSKKLGSSIREQVALEIRDKAVFWTIAWCDNKEIARYNILKASLQAMIRCVKKTKPNPDYLLVDGNKGLEELMIPSFALVSGDRLSASIGAASILAKVFRDKYMGELHYEYPEYGWNNNAGYPTLKHYEALQSFGYSPYHRTTFRLRTQKKYRKGI